MTRFQKIGTRLFRIGGNSKNSACRKLSPAIEPLESRILLTTFVVDSVGDDASGVADGNLTLREAITAASTNAAFGDAPAGDATIDRIRFKGSLQGKRINVTNGEHSIVGLTEIDGGNRNITIDANNLSRVFEIDTTQSVSIFDLRLTAGRIITGNGGAIYHAGGGDLRLSNVRIDKSSAGGSGGGGLYHDAGDLRIDSSEFKSNTAFGVSGSGGGLFSNDGKVIVSDSKFTENVANRAGGGIEVVDGTLLLRDSIFGGANAGAGNVAGPTGTAAPGNGGALHVSGSATSNVTGGNVQNNVAASEGGGFWNQSGATMTVNGTTISDNTASGNASHDGGGGIFNNGGTLRIDNATIEGNNADGALGSGGGIFSTDGNVIIASTTISANSANRAGGGFEIVDGLGIFRDVVLGGTASGDGNIAGPTGIASPGNGGGIHVTGSSARVVVLGGVVRNNRAESEGGGIWNQSGSNLVVRQNTEFNRNRAFGDSSANGGGAIFNNGGTISVNGAKFFRNGAVGISGSGGAILSTDGNVTLANADFISNRARRAGGGIEIINGTLRVNKSDFGTSDSSSANIAGSSGANPGNGGAVHVSGNSALTVFARTDFRNNVADSGGGALWNQSGSRMIVRNNSKIIDNTAKGAFAGGGGIFNNGGDVLITNATIRSNRANGTSGNGGGVLSTDGKVTIKSSSVRENFARKSGGGFWNDAGSELTVSNGTSLLDNSAAGNAANEGGGGLYNSGGDVRIDSSSIVSNVAHGTSGSGGGVFSTDGNVVFVDSSIRGNSASRTGGGIEVITGRVSLNGSSLGGSSTTDGNIAGPSGLASPGNGGGLHVSGTAARVVIRGGTVRNNVAANEGGGLWNQAGSAIVVSGNTSIASNIALGDGADNGGGGLFNNGGNVNLSNVVITSNTAVGTSGSGGGIFSSDGKVIVKNSTVRSNVANRAGGGIEVVTGEMTLDNSVLENNVAGSAGQANPGNGGGLHVSGSGASVVLRGGSVRSNQATDEGGGLWHQAGSSLVLRGTTLTGNVANGNGSATGGGAIFNNGGDANLRDVRIVGNTANGGQGGGIHAKAGSDTFVGNSLIRGNTATLEGGGIFNGGDATLNNSDITANVASNGGGVFTATSGTTTISGTTISGNTPNDQA